MASNTRWFDVPGYPGYQANAAGQVRTMRYRRVGHILIPGKIGDIALTSPAGKRKRFRAATVAAMATVPGFDIATHAARIECGKVVILERRPPGDGWVRIPGHSNNYWVRADGAIWSEGGKGAKTWDPGYLEPVINNVTGYLMCGLRAGPDAKQGLTRTVHQLVAEAFIGPRPPGMVTDHVNGNKLDPRLENLRYVTHRQNSKGKHARSFSYRSIFRALVKDGRYTEHELRPYFGRRL